MNNEKRLEEIFKEIDVAKEKLLEATIESEINFWRNYITLNELELSQIEIGGK